MRSPSIKTKLILAVSALVTVVLVAASSALFAYYEHTTKEQIADAQFTLATLVANDIDDKLTSAHAELIELARVVEPDFLRDPLRAEAFLDRHLRIQAFFSNGLFLFDPRGTLVAEAPQFNRKGWDFGFREYLVTTLRTRLPHIGVPYRSSRPGSPPAIMMTAPVFDGRGDLVGVLGGSVDLLNDSVLGRTVRIHTGKTGYFYIFDRARTMILHPDPARVLKQDVPAGANKLFDRALEGFEGTGETVNSRGLHAITSFKRLHATDWIVGVNTPTAEAYAPIERARRTLWLVVAATVLALTVMVWHLVNLLARPLLAFTAHVESISQKQGSARRVALGQRDEIGQLAEAFNRMVADLDAKQLEVEAERARQQVLQTHLTQAQKMEAVGQLAGGIAHDFNNLLSVILAYAGSLREELPEGDLRSSALEIERAGHRATVLTRQLLAFSRRQVLAPEVLEVREVVGNVTHMIGRLIGEHIELVGDVAGSAGHVHMDPSLLEQVLVNLAVNSRDAMPDGGKLTIEARDVEVGAGTVGRLAPGPYVKILVSDTGTGMDAATMARIFEPFFTTKPKGKGTGLGLAMVYGAVEQSGGAIGVASTLGAGTTFTVHLPRVSAPAPRAERRAPDAAPRGEGERVLVVEDEPQLRATLSRFLSAGGYEVIEAANGDEGLAAFQAQRDRIDLVLTDLVMPGTGGLVLGRAVREIRAVPVLYMSGYSEEVASGREHVRPEVFLQKPFDRGTLLSRVRAALVTAC